MAVPKISWIHLLAARRKPPASRTTIASALVLLLCLAGAGVARAGEDAIAIDRRIPFADRSEIRDSIRDECGLTAKLSKRILERSIKKDVAIVRVSKSEKASGTKTFRRHLDLRITDAIETSGGLLPTHSLSIDGVLKEGRHVVGTFVGTRFARASLIPFRRGECAVLKEAVNLLAKDVVKWVRKPSLDARLGDAR